MSRIHLLHIGKTGGTALKRALQPVISQGEIKSCKHDVKLSDVPVGCKLAFSVRDPISRFVSAFNSRLRKGYPLHLNEWSAGEAEAFARFSTPNDLAEALSSPDAGWRGRAMAAMGQIYHVSHPLKTWLVSVEYLRQRQDDVLFVFDQRRLEDDFELFVRRAGLPKELRLPTDPVVAHRTPDGFSKYLSIQAVSNLRSWYADDFGLYRASLHLRHVRRLSGTLSAG